MQIDVLANNTVKITLNRIDMTEYDVSFDSLSQKNPDTKRLLVELLTIIRLEKNLDLTDGRLFIEAFPRNDGGCMLYISCLKKLNEKNSSKMKSNEPSKSIYKSCLVCEVDNINSLTQLCVHLNTEAKSLKSSIFSLEKKYRLIIKDTAIINDRVFRIIKEYGKIIGISKIVEAKTKEHFSPIIIGNGIKTIAELLGKKYIPDNQNQVND
ncbi:MAG: adaptor protein MecA [Clostridiales bacterium]|nr:adaptor protein MecA [Clostridiales bacterium]